MPETVPITVKWTKSSFPVEIDTTQSVPTFKMQLFSLTGVPPARQKIMGFPKAKGLLKDDADWSTVGLKPDLKVTMMGTAEAPPENLNTNQVFLEDLPPEEQDTTGLSKYGAGLTNLGNTCYMNSTLQCLYNVPPLKSSLADYAGQHPLTKSAGSLFQQMDKSAVAVSPMWFLSAMRSAFPQFDQVGREGFHMQQDAEECLGSLLQSMRSEMPSVEETFGIRTRSTLKAEAGTDETMEVTNSELLLKCNIDSTVNHVSDGLKLALVDDREKTSTHPATEGQLIKFTGQAAIVSLPPFLTIQMVRFYYKADIQQKAKILRKVAFPMVLDVYDLCDDALKEQLRPFREAEVAEVADGAAGGADSKKQKTDEESTDAAAAADQPGREHDGRGQHEPPVAMDTAEEAVTGPTGRYELVGVLTHKGRSADSGHYVSWTKSPTDGQWVQFDDDQMILRKDEEVLALSGGGDWHMAYLLLYKEVRATRAAKGTTATATATAS